jgi:hypothetical protein
MSGDVDGVDLELLDLADRDERRVLIEAEHPMLRQALGRRDRARRAGGQPEAAHCAA